MLKGQISQPLLLNNDASVNYIENAQFDAD